ncbi:invasin [Citrobacter freundii]|nr:invasin [Citrobacter freundii]
MLMQTVLPASLSAGTLPHMGFDEPDTSAGLSSKDDELERWMAQSSASLAGVIESRAHAGDYISGYARQMAESQGNQYLGDAVRALSPSARLRGGVSLDEDFRFKSVEADLLIPVHESTSSILFGQLGLRTHDKSSFDGRTFFNTGIGYRQDVNRWMLGLNAFVDTDIKNNHVRGSLGAEAFRDYVSFAGNYYFPLTDWKASTYHDLHDERPAYGFDVRAKGYLPAYPHLGMELTWEQYYGDKVDILGNGKMTSDPRAATASIMYKPVPLVEVTAGYRDAHNAGTQAHAGLNFNYVFGQKLSEQLDAGRVTLPDNRQNRTEFVSRNYNIVMEYREQESRITLSLKPISGLSETQVTLTPSVNSRYPIVSYQWSGDAELLAGMADTQAADTTVTLPALPLDTTESKSYGLYLTATDSRGVSATSERIPVTVGINTAVFKSFVELVNKDAVVKDGVYQVPVGPGNEVVLEWRFVRVRAKDDFAYIKPETFKYEAPASYVKSESLGGDMVDGVWTEKVRVTLDTRQPATLTPGKNILAWGPNEKTPATAKVALNPQVSAGADRITQLSVEYTAGNEILNGSTTSPVVNTVLKARAQCGPQDCTADWQYIWQVSADGVSWEDVPDVKVEAWKMPAVLNGKSLQGYQVRIKAEA